MPLSETGAPPLAIALFGPMRVTTNGSPAPRLRSRKTLWLLALLTLRHGRPIEREWIAGTLWPETTQSQAYAGLRPILTELRQMLQAESHRLQSPSRHTLLLDLDGAEIDVITFDAAMASQNPAAIERAAALYHGPLLEGCFEEWALPERAQREKQCLTALRMLSQNALAAGNAGAAAEFCRRAAAIDPWRDTAQREWMEALVQAGDSNAALQVYRDFVHLLSSDPQAAPDAQTTLLYTRLRKEARRRNAPPAPAGGEGETEKTAPQSAGYLPSPLTEMIGREDERVDLAARLGRSRLVTITGPGGVGKTRLAIGVANDALARYPDGVWMTALETLTDGAMAASCIASHLGVREEAARAPLESLTDHLRHKKLLLVLDNCEHLLDACARIAAHLLRECPGVRILATSREALGIVGETAWTTPSLDVPAPDHLPAGHATQVRVLSGYESVQLFVERAQAANRAFALTGNNALSVARICYQTEGIPLAIELAAARIKSMTPQQIENHLDDYLGLLSLGGRASASRQQTLRGTFDWSYALLNDQERRLLAHLSVFAGGWSVEAAEQVHSGESAPSTQILNLLTSLVDKSLVVFEDQEWNGNGRYRLLEMVRQYASERLLESGELDQVRARHCDWCLSLAEEAEAHANQPDSHLWNARLEKEHGNLRAALRWSAQDTRRSGAYLKLAGEMRTFWYMQGYYSEGLEHLRTALEGTDPQPPAIARGTALNGLSVLLYCQGRQIEAREALREALEIHRALEDTAGIARSLANLGNIECALGNYASSMTLFEEALAIRREIDDKAGIASSLIALGAISIVRGDYLTARTQYAEGLKMRREIGVTHLIANALTKCGDIDHLQKEYASAQRQYEEALAIYGASGNRRGVADCLGCLGNVALARGDEVSARAFYDDSLRVRRELGEQRGVATLLSCLASVSQSEGDYETARTMHQESLSLQRELEDKHGIARSLQGLAEALLAQGRAGEAATLFGASHGLRASLTAALTAREQETDQHHIDQLGQALAPDAVAQAWERGRAMTWAQAVEHALADDRAAGELPAPQ
ncbi:hypothetical protein CCAX7_005630 [Capsulimonas corticalis]|uniref:Uncharacterized protein n=1 Tax=Capsulimonas corticalis TaxID=2219043 RepID=A0A402D3B8_9BACT|nr:tetratricopeptide repeat protein [Capsulimonas corticalis]BDI28512.1 hypothetical protein CCAX7_005630 [Capsulimonas corticalis]